MQWRRIYTHTHTVLFLLHGEWACSIHCSEYPKVLFQASESIASDQRAAALGQERQLTMDRSHFLESRVARCLPPCSFFMSSRLAVSANSYSVCQSSAKVVACLSTVLAEAANIGL